MVVIANEYQIKCSDAQLGTNARWFISLMDTHVGGRCNTHTWVV